MEKLGGGWELSSTASQSHLEGPMLGVQGLATSLGFGDLQGGNQTTALQSLGGQGGPLIPPDSGRAVGPTGGTPVVPDGGKTLKDGGIDLEELKAKLDQVRRQAGIGVPVKRAEVGALVAMRTLEASKERERERVREREQEDGRNRSRSRRRRRRSSRDRGRRRRRTESRSHSRSWSSSGSDLRLRDTNRIRRLAQEKPGELLLTTIGNLRTFLDRAEALPVGAAQAKVLQPVFLRYHLLAHEAVGNLGQRNLRELRTLSEVLDLVVRGEVMKAADVLVQRFKAVELASQEGSWLVAQHPELIPPTRMAAAEDKERDLAVREEAKSQKVRERRGNN